MSQPVVFGSYELLDRIAEGGMAEVWRARARGVAGFEKTVVIKRVLPSLMQKPAFAELLIREAKIAARLSHPRIVQIFDLGEENGSYFIAMEYVHGRDLGQAMAHRDGMTRDGLSLPLRVWIVAEAAGALDHAHRRKGEEGRPMQIVHRDVSPQNILLGYEGEVKVADFGIARADEQGLGRGEDPKILRGKYAYMSPEQARGESLDRRSDIFSLGIVLYELITGRRMFRGKSSQETLALVRAAELPALDPDELGIDPALAAALARCLSPSRDERYPHASELYADLTQWLFRRGEPVGQPFLAETMARMFPPDDAAVPNKLRVDVLMRAHQDATAVSVAGALLAVPDGAGSDEAGQRTAAMPVSRKLRLERRRVAVLAVVHREGEDDAFARACDSVSGTVFAAQDGLRLGVFGHAAGVERGVAHAARAALELRRVLRFEGATRLDPVPAMVVLDGEGRVVEGVAIEPDPDLALRAHALLEGAHPGEIRFAPALVSELGAFHIADDATRPPVIDGLRPRSERTADALRRRAPLVGRREELRVLSEAIVAVTSGAQRVFHVVGEPGAGKSRLLAELRALVTARDVHVITGRADEAHAEQPLAMLGDLVRDLCGVEAEDTPAERFAKIDRLRVLALTPREVRLCGELLGLAYPVPREEREGRPRSIEIVVAVRKAIAALAHDRTVVVVLEDLQWLDDATRQLVPFLVRGLHRPRVLVVLTRRPGSIAPHVPGESLRLDPLPPDACGRLFAALLGARATEPDLGAAIVTETGGNPAWIEMLATEARAVGSIEIEDHVVRASSALPTYVSTPARNLLAARLAQLRPSDRSLLLTAAALEGPVPVELLWGIEGLVGATGMPALRRLLARRLLVSVDRDPAIDAMALESLGRWGGDDPTRGRPASVSLPGEMVRRAVLATIDPADLPRLHARIVGALERLQSAPAHDAMRRLAHHASRSSDRRRAPEYLERAADDARRAGRAIEATEALMLAAEILRQEGEDLAGERTLELGLRAARIAIDAAEIDRARSILEALAKVLGAHGRASARIAIAIERALVASLGDQPDEALLALASVEAIVADAPAIDRAALRLASGRALLEVGRVDDALDVLAEAVSTYRAAGDAAGRGRALSVLALAEARADRVREADDTAEEALAVAARLGHADLRYAALAAMGAAEEAAGDLQGAAARFREAAEVATHASLDAERPVAALRAALACLRAGEGHEAAQRVQQATSFARKRRLERIALLGSAMQAVLAMQDHADSSYVPAIVRAIDRLEALGRLGDAAIAVEMLALAHRALGDPGAATRALARGVELARRAGWASLARMLDASART